MIVGRIKCGLLLNIAERDRFICYGIIVMWTFYGHKRICISRALYGIPITGACIVNLDVAMRPGCRCTHEPCIWLEVLEGALRYYFSYIDQKNELSSAPVSSLPICGGNNVSEERELLTSFSPLITTM